MKNQRLIRILSFVFLGLSVFAVGCSDRFNEGKMAYDAGDYVTALEVWEPMAEKGDKRAQNYLGMMYSRGQGVETDIVEAARLFRASAEQGFARGQFNLGVLYANGESLPQDFVKAHMWFTLSARQGLAKASEGLDLCEANMSPDQIAESEALVAEWRPTG